jgi:endonuclease/exonuclease/phosphatase family metal-dependent hydrolase
VVRLLFSLRSLAALFAAALLATGAPARAGSFTVLTYNVAGLPASFGGEGEVNNVLVSPLLNGFDLVVIQEDFFFHDDLTHAIDYPYVSEKSVTGAAGSGDGLLRLSQSPFSDFVRVPWDACFGTLTNASDCLTPKGFSVARHELEPGVFLDVYNHHAEAGGDLEDQAARLIGLRQMVDFAEVYSAGNAMLLMGDINSRYNEVGEILHEVVADLTLSDVWIELTRGGVFPVEGAPRLEDCADPAGGDCERIDKVFYRSSDALLLTPTSYAVPDEEFQDDAGIPLSDHLPVVASFDYQAVPEPAVWMLAAVGLAERLCRRRTISPDG